MATILVVDDNAANRKLLVATLSGDGHLTLEATDGIEGFRVAKERRPQLIISDIVMPSMDGYGFVRALRIDPQLAATPVIFYTAQYHESEAHHLAMACGVTRVLIKPCPGAELLRVVEQVMGGVSESPPPALPENFDREHLRLVTDKLSERVQALAASNSRLEAFAELSMGLIAESDRGELLQNGCAGARSLLGARFAVLAVSKQSDERDVLFSTSGIGVCESPLEPPALNEGVLGTVLADRRPLRARSLNGTALTVGFPSGYPEVQAILAVPIATAGRGFGWLCLADKIGANEFTEGDERLLTNLGTLIAHRIDDIDLRIALRKIGDLLESGEQV